MAKRKRVTSQSRVTSIEISHRTPDHLVEGESPLAVMFARTGKALMADGARWFDTPTPASLGRVWRVINGLPAINTEVSNDRTARR